MPTMIASTGSAILLIDPAYSGAAVISSVGVNE
jgi:hypothetical protein